jgi:hypothetical protein
VVFFSSLTKSFPNTMPGARILANFFWTTRPSYVQAPSSTPASFIAATIWNSSPSFTKAVFEGSLMIDSGNGQAQSAKVNPTQNKAAACRGAAAVTGSGLIPYRRGKNKTAMKIKMKTFPSTLIALVCATLLSSHPVRAQFSQQGPKLVGTGAVGPSVFQGRSVSISADAGTSFESGRLDLVGCNLRWFRCLVHAQAALKSELRPGRQNWTQPVMTGKIQGVTLFR